jgi:hypothetical protein
MLVIHNFGMLGQFILFIPETNLLRTTTRHNIFWDFEPPADPSIAGSECLKMSLSSHVQRMQDFVLISQVMQSVTSNNNCVSPDS